jgi:hypothetical protein
MSARFAESCRVSALRLEGFESDVEVSNILDGRSNSQLQLNCDNDIYLGVFFDGTNNNKYRDTPTFSHTNVARLYEAYPGTPAAQHAPVFEPRVNPDGSTTPRTVFPDREFRASSVPAEDYPWYRKVYVPGLGTAFPDVGDDGTGMQKTAGLAAAMLGQVRLDWASLQLLNQVHAAVFREPLEPFFELPRLLLRKGRPLGVVGRPALLAHLPLGTSLLLHDAMQKRWNEFERTTGRYSRTAYESLLGAQERRLTWALAQRGRNKPHVRKIRLSVFGFSRGSAAARSWVQQVTRRWGDLLAGIPLQIDFLGLFDTVASVGLVQSTPHFNGHAAWADDPFMPVPPDVRRCVHLVAAHEVRGAFPLDSVCQSGMLPPHCKEIVYPGVHSDVGGGYPPEDQGRAPGDGADGDKRKLSQVPLAQMYREARMAGVPLAPETAFLEAHRRNFAIDPQLREDFNAYVAATRSGEVPPTQGTGQARFAAMFPTETQPREDLHRVMRRHAGYQLRWRKALLDAPGGIAALPGLARSRSGSRHQDIEDFRGAEQELRQEVAFLQDPDPRKFKALDDPFFDGTLLKVRAGAAASLLGTHPIGLHLLVGAWGAERSLGDLLRDKQAQWDGWLRGEWMRNDDGALPDAVRRLFEHHVHDSRAWFKLFARADGRGMMPDDEAWFVFGGHDRERRERLAELARNIAYDRAFGNAQAVAGSQQALAAMQQDERLPLLHGGREPYRMWGYLRHRRLYQAGRPVPDPWTWNQRVVDEEEQRRIERAQRDRRAAAARRRHATRLQELDDKLRELRSRPHRTTTSTGPGPWRLPVEDEAAYMDRHHAEVRRADADLAAELSALEQAAEATP